MTPNELKTLRTRAGLSQEGLARVLDVSSNTVARWERGVIAPIPTVVSIAIRCVCTPHDKPGKRSTSEKVVSIDSARMDAHRELGELTSTGDAETHAILIDAVFWDTYNALEARRTYQDSERGADKSVFYSARGFTHMTMGGNADGIPQRPDSRRVDRRLQRRAYSAYGQYSTDQLLAYHEVWAIAWTATGGKLPAVELEEWEGVA